MVIPSFMTQISYDRPDISRVTATFCHQLQVFCKAICYKWAFSSDAQSLEHIIGVFTFHKPLALFAVLEHLQGFIIRYFHGKG